MPSSEGPVFLAGKKTVTAARGAEALTATPRVKSVVIIAKSGNIGQVYVGGSDIAAATNDGLDAGETLSIEARGWLDLGGIYLDEDTNGEGVDFYAVKA